MSDADRPRSSARSGVVYLVGAGPGDPGLLTERAAELLESADVVMHDELVAASLLRRARSDAEVVHVGKRGSGSREKQAKQSAIDAELVLRARRGQSVVRLKGGDPYLFGRGSEEAESLVRAGVAFEVVPGVTSPVAAAAYAGFSLTHRDLASSVTFVSATLRDGSLFDFSELAHVRGTICVLMGLRRLEAVCESLVEHAGRARSTPAAMIESASDPGQRVALGELHDIAARARDAKLKSPSVLIVGDVVRLRDRLRWFDAWPLFGKRILVTRAEHQAESTSMLLRRRGAEAIEVATIAVHPAPDPALVRRAVDEMGNAQVVVFTSENGVAKLFDAIDAAGKDARAFGSARVAAIGVGTARALVKRGIKPDIVPKEFRGEALAEAILADFRARHIEPVGARALIPRALVAREVLPETLRAAGMNVDVVPVYETRMASADRRSELVSMLEARTIDSALITSPSTVDNLVELLGSDAGRLLESVVVASIGEITTAAALRNGLNVHVTARVSTIAGVVEALEEHFASMPAPA